MCVLPLVLIHINAVGVDPEYIVNTVVVDGIAFKEVSTSKAWVAFSKGDQALTEFKQFLIGTGQIPLKPADFIVLTIRIVVTPLAPTAFVPRREHGSTLRERRCG